MNANGKYITVIVGGVLCAAILAGTACARQNGAADTQSSKSESGVVTNDNGSVSRSFTECTITTNGNMVTEHRRETRTTLDTDGNMLQTTTSEYAQSYPVGDSVSSLSEKTKSLATTQESVANDSFMGLKFGAKFEGTNFVADVNEPTLLRATFIPKKTLAGFDDYFVYVTPTTHKVAKVYACAKEVIEPGASWRRHYLIEALEKKYGTWARLASYWKPLYAFDLGDSRELRICLAGSNDVYETIIVAWDGNVLTEAANEIEVIRAEARKNAAKNRANRVNDAADAF